MPVGVSFGTTTSRFKATSRKERTASVSPATYYPIWKPHYKRSSESIWDRKKRTEEFSKTLGDKLYTIPHIHERMMQETLVGPGTDRIGNTCCKSKGMSKGKVFTTTQRYDATKSNNPPPGTYIPDIFKYSSVVKKQRTKVPSFEWDSFKDRFRSHCNTNALPPNIYNPVDFSSLEALCKKTVSVRGPYDLFTGPRDGTTIKNYFATTRTSGADVFYAFSSDLDHLLRHPKKKYYGKFTLPKKKPKTPCTEEHVHVATCYVTPPGPTTYDITGHRIKKCKPSKVPFNKSARKARTGAAVQDTPGPGRYFLTDNATKSNRRRAIRRYQRLRIHKSQKQPFRYF